MHLMLRLFAICVLAALPMTASAELAGAVRVIDADTWDVGTARVRLFGIDAPEQDQTCAETGAGAWRCGAWATEQTRARFEGARATCQVLDRDRYGRVIARCYVGGVDAARQIVDQGWAMAYLRYTDDYAAAERVAASRALGLHRAQVQSPDAFRKAQTQGRQPPALDCAIKGNISEQGVRIYHVPDQRFYDRTRINLTAGERWFCTEDEARAAGWRPAKR